MTIEKIVQELKQQMARCLTHCATWNREDRDCEIYGSYHPSPARCRRFLESELERRNGGKNEL